MTCKCRIQYVGKTYGEFRVQIREHVRDIKNRNDATMARHVWKDHEGDLFSIKFQGVELVTPPIHGGDFYCISLQQRLDGSVHYPPKKLRV
ncbi:hypothetical protein GDO81_024209 [Engystomops pustulosus]|uniref:GIY-YIG domain-containing protein n=1 Tax=Engystomops pustulosus TaxID=76066 RepID=A0AAV6YR25_ENGPU|nr:hypothetical protein GDO81_024209 [Engystomops pustulosus]